MKIRKTILVLLTLLLGACATSRPVIIYQNSPAGGVYRTFSLSPSMGPRHIVNADNVLLPFFREEMQAKGYQPVDHDADIDVVYEVRVFIRRQVSQVPVAGTENVKYRSTLDETQRGMLALMVTDAKTGAVVYTSSIKGEVSDSITDEQLHVVVRGLLEHLPPAVKR